MPSTREIEKRQLRPRARRVGNSTGSACILRAPLGILPEGSFAACEASLGFAAAIGTHVAEAWNPKQFAVTVRGLVRDDSRGC